MSAFSNAVNELNNALLMITGTGTNEQNAKFISLHSASPGTTGANEITGGSPAYARVATTWGAIAAGSVTGSQVTLNVPVLTITHWGLWTTASGASGYIDGGLLPASQTYATQGTYLLTPTLTAA